MITMKKVKELILKSLKEGPKSARQLGEELGRKHYYCLTAIYQLRKEGRVERDFYDDFSSSHRGGRAGYRWRLTY